MSVGMLTSAFRVGLSALRASQEGLNVASQNIANANTPGYVRVEIEQAPRSMLGPGGGVDTSSIYRAADQFLAAATYLAESTRGAADVRADLLDRAQAYFGDPSGETSVFAALDRIWAAFTDAGVDASSTARRQAAVDSISEAFGEIARVAGDVQGLISEADDRIAAKVSEAQSLIDRIHALNSEIQFSKRVGAETTGSENTQSNLIDQLSSLLDIRVTPQASGGVQIRTVTGALLVGEQKASISYTPSGRTFGAFPAISYQISADQPSNLEPFIAGGEIGGLLQARDVDLPGLADALGALAGELGDALNEIHNLNTASPATNSLTGRQTGLLSTDALNFSGTATIGVTDSSGNLQRRLTIAFSGSPPRIDVETSSGASSYTFSNTIASFTSALGLALGADGAASFVNGSLQLSATNGGGLVMGQADVGSGGASRAGRGFAHFFGLNDVVTRATPLFFETGGLSSDAHGLASGGQLTFDVRDVTGRVVQQPTFAIAGALNNPGSTWANLVTALNDPTTGLGKYATFSYDTEGRLSYTPNAGYSVDITNDTTTRGATGLSLTSLFGIGPASGATRAVQADVSSSIINNPANLALGRADLTAAIGARIIETGDNRGAALLAHAGDTARSFGAAGAMAAQTTTLSSYAARLAGEAGRLATDAERSATGATAIAKAASDRRADVEGVNLDDELVRMTVYQNSYAAASRIIQAADEMFQILLQLGR